MQAAIDHPRFKTHIDLSADVREQMIGLLNQHLANTFDLYSQTKQAHWNVKGAQFIALHELFDKLAAELLAYVDMIAERGVALGGTALGTARMAAEASQVDEYPLVTDGAAHVEALVARYARAGAGIRAAIAAAEDAADVSTADLFTEVSRGIDKALWFLEAHLQDKPL